LEIFVGLNYRLYSVFTFRLPVVISRMQKTIHADSK